MKSSKGGSSDELESASEQEQNSLKGSASEQEQDQAQRRASGGRIFDDWDSDASSSDPRKSHDSGSGDGMCT